MALRHFLAAKRREQPDDVRLHHAMGGPAQPEIAVFRIGPQPVGPEILVPVMADGEPLCRPRLGPGRGHRAFRGALPPRGSCRTPRLHLRFRSWHEPLLRFSGMRARIKMNDKAPDVGGQEGRAIARGPSPHIFYSVRLLQGARSGNRARETAVTWEAA